MKLRLGIFTWAVVCGLTFFLPTPSRGVTVAENLLVDLDALNLAVDDVSWVNTGTLGGTFNINGAAGAALNLFGVDTANNPIIGVEFNGSVAYQGPVAPASISGAGTRTIEVWAFNPDAVNEETMVSWGRRGGGNGTNLSFNYGSNPVFGGVGHWGAPDMGWNGTPAVGQWHHLVYTFDGSAARIYDNGVIKNLRQLPLNTHGLGFNNGVGDGNFTISVGAQNINPAPSLEPTLRLSGAIGKIRVHDGVLSTADVIDNFLEEAPAFLPVVPPAPPLPPPLPPPPSPELLQFGPVHRYSFNGDANDSVGGANGSIVNPTGNFASFATVPGQLDLRANNNISSNQNFALATTNGAFVNLPNGIISSLGLAGQARATFEAWFTAETNRTWARIFDFGRSDVGEDSSAGAPNSNYIFFAPQAASGTGGAARLAHRANPGAGFTENLVDDGRILPAGVEHHMAVVWDEVAQTQTLYVDGQRLFAYDLGAPTNEFIIPTSSPILANMSLATLQDLNNFLGRSQWGDPLFDGLFNEFRIYDFALTPGQVYKNFLAGPDAVSLVPEPGTFVLAALGAIVGLLSIVRWRRRSTAPA